MARAQRLVSRFGPGFVVGACFLAAPALAEETPPVVEITVTGTKHETPLQTTPVSISAVPGATLVNSGTEDVSQLGRLAPGFIPVDGGPSNARLVIRGIQAVGEPTVGLYYDETPVTGSVGASNDAAATTPQLKLFDVERVEVLRGPQGTLFGASAMSGAVRVLYRKPSFAYEGLASVTGAVTQGGAPSYTAQGVVNAPLIDNLLAVRFMLFDERRGGYVDNVFLDRSNIDKEHSRGGRLLLRATPTRRLTIDGAAYFQLTRGQAHTWNQTSGPYKSIAQVQLPSDERFDIFSLTPRYDFGPVELVGSASYATRRLDQAVGDPSYFFATQLDNPAACARSRGSDCSADDLLAFNEHVQTVIPGAIYWGQTTKTTTAELRASSKNASFLQWTIGGFFSRRRAAADITEMPADAASGELLEPMRPQFLRVVKDKLSQLALFADASAHLTARLALTAGVRGFVYRREVGGNIVVPLDLLGGQATPFSTTSLTEKGVIPKFGASYELTNDHFVYAQVAEGFRPGGVNQVNGLPEALAPYKSDRAWSYELGAKTSWLARRLSMNASGYLMDWDDIQVSGSRPDGLFRFLSNAGAARVWGAELELAIYPISGLRLDANGTVLDARLSEDQVNGTVVAPGRKGDRIPYVPHWAGGLGAQYVAPFSAALSLFSRVDASCVGSSRSELRPDNPFRRRIDAYGLVNLRLGVQSPTTSWAAFVFVNNVAGATAIHYATANGVTLGETSVTSASPRTFGLNLRRFF